MGQAELKVIGGTSRGDVFRFPLDEAAAVTLGRSPGNVIVLAESEAAPEHAKIIWREGAPYLVDLGTASGTWLMGFRVSPGEDGARIEPGDEFKIGRTLFKFSFHEEQQSDSRRLEEAATESARRRSKKTKIIIALMLTAIVLLILLLPEQTGKPLQSKAILSPVGDRVAGFYVPPSPGGAGDRAHPFEARFAVPVKDQLLEFDFLNKSPLNLLLDDAPIGRIPGGGAGWQKGQMIIPDLVSGQKRTLLIQNTGRGAGGMPDPWAVRRMRASGLSEVPAAALPQNLPAQIDHALQKGIDQLQTAPVAPEGLFLAVRALQRTIVPMLVELKLPGTNYAIELDAPEPDLLRLRERLAAIRAERGGAEASPGVEQQTKHLNELIGMARQLDAELWRRFYSRTNAARLAAKAKNYDGAFDYLAGARKLMPAADDYRRKEVERLLRDTTIVPKDVMRKREKYLQQP